MHVAAVRTVFVSALAALTLLACALFVAAPKASASISECPENSVCVWAARNYEGQFSYWAASEKGCHNHANNKEIRSIANWTGHKVEVVGRFILEPDIGVSLNPGEGPITTAICW
jgi:Peptidase inhibitor family I36